MPKVRLDVLLTERGLVESRAKAQALIMAGQVRVNGQTALKAGATIASDSALEVEAGPRFVSRGGEKLDAALEALSINVRDFVCADVGASTGGFTDCLLQRGAAKVYAIDTGMAGTVGFSFRENLGHLLENQVYLELKRRGNELYYYKTGNGLEVDFACCTGGKISKLIQVVHTLGDEGTRNRELRSLIKALEETGLESGEIITYEDEEELSVDGKLIRLVPAFKYLLNTEPI